MNVQDQKLESRIAELQQQLDAANKHIEELKRAIDVADQSMTYFKTGKEAAERKLATVVGAGRYALESFEDIGAHCNDATARKICIAAHTVLTKALAQIKPPQEPPVEPATDYREIGREMADNRYANLVHAANRGVKCRETLESLISLCNERGLTVEYGDHGQVTLSEDPKPQRPGEDPPFDACHCPACVTIRAKSRSKP